MQGIKTKIPPDDLTRFLSEDLMMTAFVPPEISQSEHYARMIAETMVEVLVYQSGSQRVSAIDIYQNTPKSDITWFLKNGEKAEQNSP